MNWTRAGLRPDRSSGWAAIVLGDLEDARRRRSPADEPVGDLDVTAGPLVGTVVEPDEVPLAIDELPLVGAARLLRRGRDGRHAAPQELRVKESDRIADRRRRRCTASAATSRRPRTASSSRGTGGLRGGVDRLARRPPPGDARRGRRPGVARGGRGRRHGGRRGLLSRLRRRRRRRSYSASSRRRSPTNAYSASGAGERQQRPRRRASRRVPDERHDRARQREGRTASARSTPASPGSSRARGGRAARASASASPRRPSPATARRRSSAASSASCQVASPARSPRSASGARPQARYMNRIRWRGSPCQRHEQAPEDAARAARREDEPEVAAGRPRSLRIR